MASNQTRAGTICWAITAGSALLAAALAIGCGGMPTAAPGQRPAPAGPRGEGPGGRPQPLALTPKQELAVGRRAYTEVMDQYGARVLPESDRQVRRVRQITERIARASEIESLQREINLRLRGYRFDWKVNVVQEAKVNAFCLPGGEVFVFTGILLVAKDDDQLATVLSHEIAHALAHHASERIAREQRSGGGIMNTLSNLRHSREQESEADHIGIFLMTIAGYDPHKAVLFWQNMQQKMAGQHPPEFLSDHPSDEHRIAKMREWVPMALKGKKAFDEGRIAPGGQ